MSGTKPKNGKLAFILFDSLRSPRYYEIKKSFLKFLLVFLPALTMVSIVVTCLFFFYFKDLKTSLATREPKIITELRQQALAQKKIIEQLKLEKKKLQTKLNSPVIPQLATLNLFKPTQGREDLTAKSVVSISNSQAVAKRNKLYFTFDLVNTTTNNQRLSGYLFIVFRTKKTLQVYPETSFAPGEMEILYSHGEFFSTARFRTTEAIFNIPNGVAMGATGHFKILIFSRTGDLLHKEIINKENIK